MTETELQTWYLQQMDITRWVCRDAPGKRDTQGLPDTLEAEVAACTRCILHRTRSRTVFARGNPEASLMVIGEAPGFYEDKEGMPFVGKAGRLLDAMLASIGLDTGSVYIANVIKCRPPDNRDPQAEEIQACSGWLTRQIAQVNPRVILAVGRFAGQFLTGSTQPMRQLRATVHHYQSIPCVVSFHPAYLLRNPADKKKAWQDLHHVIELLESVACNPAGA